MCHPLGEEKLWAHRVFVSLARDLANAGFVVLRFDCRGEGDSDRDARQSIPPCRVRRCCQGRCADHLNGNPRQGSIVGRKNRVAEGDRFRGCIIRMRTDECNYRQKAGE